MLTADLVDARRKDRELVLRPLDEGARDDALALGAAYLEAARALVGHSREEIEDAWNEVSAGALPKRFKLAAGLKKLVADACSFEAEAPVDTVELRRLLFTHASEARRTTHEGEPFARDRVIAEAAALLGIAPEAVERGMFADLRGEHLLREAPVIDPPHLVEQWELGQAQAVLLNAVRVTCEVTSASPGPVRAFFAKLKFHKLLFRAERIDEGWRVIVDGPYSMFDAVTKYGLKLAFLLPALRCLEAWSLVADIRWGKAREPLAFRLASASTAEPSSHELHLADEVRELAEGIDALAAGCRARPTTVLLDVPGEGVCIPDLELSYDDGRSPVYVEVLGYWSRDAVFRRVELVERGLGASVVFAVSSRLRVSEEVLDDALPSSLYVYKGKMSPRAVVEHASRRRGSDR
jgi:predicted nuclease of restriction endonuclease-like RecB superfamily